jgi:hypothetical protein
LYHWRIWLLLLQYPPLRLFAEPSSIFTFPIKGVDKTLGTVRGVEMIFVGVDIRWMPRCRPHVRTVILHFFKMRVAPSYGRNCSVVAWRTRKSTCNTFRCQLGYIWTSDLWPYLAGVDHKHLCSMKDGVFWDVTPCGSCKNWRFGGT